MEPEDEEMGGDPACWAHLFEDDDAAGEDEPTTDDPNGTTPATRPADAVQPRSSRM